MNKYLEKLAERYAHTTGDEGLDRILSSGKIQHLGHLVKKDPSLQVTVEYSHLPFLRKTMAAEEALKLMHGTKVIDKVFLTKGRFLPNYGENVIIKDLTSPTERTSFNTIPDEFVTGRALSVKSNAEVYVPDERLEEWSSKHPDTTFLPKSSLKMQPIGVLDRIKAYPFKVMKALGHDKSASKLPISPKSVSANAFLGGSSGLGLNIDDSDIDIFAPYKTESRYLKAVDRVKERFPELKQRSSTSKNPNKSTFSGKVDGKEVDVVLGWGPKAQAFSNAYEKALSGLTEEKWKEILETKRNLKNAWILSDYRYNRYKKQLASEIGLRQNYF